MKHQRLLESNFVNNSNDKTLPEYCRKARKLVFAVFIWRLSSIFDLGLCVLIGQSELSTLPPVPGLLIDSPGYEVEVCLHVQKQFEPRSRLP